MSALPVPEWLTRLLPNPVPTAQAGEEACYGIEPKALLRIGQRPRHHWDASATLYNGKRFCLRCGLFCCQVKKPDPRSGTRKTAGWRCERHSRHAGPHQNYKADGRIDRSW